MVEKNYMLEVKKLAQRPANIRDYRKIMVYSRNKKGKTRFCMSAGPETTLIIDPEGGTDAYKSRNPYVLRVRNWQQTQYAYGALRTGKLSPRELGLGESDIPFDWVALDGLTRLNNMALRYVMGVAEDRDVDRKPGLVQRADYGKSGELMRQLIYNFHSLKMNVVFTAQEKMKVGFASEGDEEDEEMAFFAPSLPDSVRAAVNEVSEVIGRLYTAKHLNEKTGEEVVQRRLWLNIHERYDTGVRSDYVLPDMIVNPTVPKLVNLMLQGKVK